MSTFKHDSYRIWFIAVLALGLTSIIAQTIIIREFFNVFYGNELVIGLILANWMLFTGFQFEVDTYIKSLLYPGQEIVYQRDTPYGNLVVARQNEQLNFYENNVLLCSGQEVKASEETVHYAMTQHQCPVNVLLIGNGISGTLKEIRIQLEMNLLNFIEQYPDEVSCRLKLKAIRDKEGIVCRKCGGTDHYWKNDKWQYECKSCKTRTTLKSGTVMHGSQLPLRYWFIAMHLLTSIKKSFSALELQRQLGHKYYEPIWGMLHKLRLSIRKRDSQYKLSGQIELDEGFFATETEPEEKEKPLRRVRGSQKKCKVLVMNERREVDGKKTKTGKPRKLDFIKMQVIQDLQAETIDDVVTTNISEKSTLITDDSTSYTNLNNLVEDHQAQVIPKGKVGEVLPWVHLAISNTKRMLLDIHHKIKPELLQNYLNEFCYKFNRRYFGEAMFDRLLLAGVTLKTNLGIEYDNHFIYLYETSMIRLLTHYLSRILSGRT